MNFSTTFCSNSVFAGDVGEDLCAAEGIKVTTETLGLRLHDWQKTERGALTARVAYLETETPDGVSPGEIVERVRFSLSGAPDGPAHLSVISEPPDPFARVPKIAIRGVEFSLGAPEEVDGELVRTLPIDGKVRIRAVMRLGNILRIQTGGWRAVSESVVCFRRQYTYAAENPAPFTEITYTPGKTPTFGIVDTDGSTDALGEYSHLEKRTAIPKPQANSKEATVCAA